MNVKNSFLFAVTSFIFIVTPLLAQDAKPATSAKDTKPAADGDKASLANQATNPAAPLIQLQLQNVFSPSNRGASGYANTFIVQPVIPIALSKTGYFQNIMTRTTLPIHTSANPDGPMTSVTGLGDTIAIAVLAHKAKISKGFGYVLGPLAAM